MRRPERAPERPVASARATASRPQLAEAPPEPSPAPGETAESLDSILARESADLDARLGYLPSAGAPAGALRLPEINEATALLADLSGGVSPRREEVVRLPARLNAGTVRSRLRARSTSFETCARQGVITAAGPVTVGTTVIIGSSGRVREHHRQRRRYLPAVQSCIRKVLESTVFPAFSDPQMVVNFPVVLR